MLFRSGTGCFLVWAAADVAVIAVIAVIAGIAGIAPDEHGVRVTAQGSQHKGHSTRVTAQKSCKPDCRKCRANQSPSYWMERFLCYAFCREK